MYVVAASNPITVCSRMVTSVTSSITVGVFEPHGPDIDESAKRNRLVPVSCVLG